MWMSLKPKILNLSKGHYVKSILMKLVPLRVGYSVDIKRTLVVTTVLLVLVMFQSATILAESDKSPPWACEGTFLAYSWCMWEYVPEDKVEPTIEEMLKLMPIKSVVSLKLINVSDEKGVFLVKIEESEAIGEYYWANATWIIGNQQAYNFLPIYKPVSNLIGLPLSRVETGLGTFYAYKEELKLDNDARSISYFHKDTGILLQQIIVSNPYTSYVRSGQTCRDVIILVLVNASITTLTPLHTIKETVVVKNKTFDILIETTSTSVKDFTLDEASREIRFTVTGVPGSRGSCNITIHKEMFEDCSDIKVYFDDKPIHFNLSESNTHYFIYFEYFHSTHTITIKFLPQSTPPTSPHQPLTLVIVTVAIIALIGMIVTLLIRRRSSFIHKHKALMTELSYNSKLNI